MEELFSACFDLEVAFRHARRDLEAGRLAPFALADGALARLRSRFDRLAASYAGRRTPRSLAAICGRAVERLEAVARFQRRWRKNYEATLFPAAAFRAGELVRGAWDEAARMPARPLPGMPGTENLRAADAVVHLRGLVGALEKRARKGKGGRPAKPLDAIDRKILAAYARDSAAGRADLKGIARRLRGEHPAVDHARVKRVVARWKKARARGRG